MAAASGAFPAGIGATFKTTAGGRGIANVSRPEHMLYYETWAAATGAEVGTAGTFLFFHGVNESVDTTTARRLAERCRERGWNFVGLEHHGHGRSEGLRGFVQSWALLEAHALAFVDHWAVTAQAEAEAAGSSRHFFFLAGHSMGGAVSARIAKRVDEKYGALGAGQDAATPKFLGQVLLAPALTCAGANACTRSILRLACCLCPQAPIGPPEDVSVYDTGSGLNMNYNGCMRLGTAALFVEATMDIKALVQGASEDMDQATKSRIRQKLEFALAIPGRPCLVLHGVDDHAVPMHKGSEQRAVYAACVPVDAADRRSRVELIAHEDHQPIAAPTSGESWESYADTALDWAAEVVRDARG